MRVVHWDGRDGRILAERANIVDSMVGKIWGLMFHKPLEQGDALVFRFNAPRPRSVHTLFVRETIDVIWVAGERVTRVETMTPWTVRRVGTGDLLVELPGGTATAVSVGDHVRLERTRPTPGDRAN